METKVKEIIDNEKETEISITDNIFHTEAKSFLKRKETFDFELDIAQEFIVNLENPNEQKSEEENDDNQDNETKEEQEEGSN